ncbi:MAG: hypothetical protein E6G65_03495 [Actinobacteria bacterium]|nr:MAG: hypothetical protein E6G65_03495 [Actinomycetota bacterium]
MGVPGRAAAACDRRPRQDRDRPRPAPETSRSAGARAPRAGVRRRRTGWDVLRDRSIADPRRPSVLRRPGRPRRVRPAGFGVRDAGLVPALGHCERRDVRDDIDRALLEGANGDGSVLISPAAAAPEGETVFDTWAGKGLAHYERLGIQARVSPLRTREDAERPDVVAMLDEASLVFFSGGNPWYLATVLLGTPFWARLQERLQDGLAYAGCSAGVACLSEMTYDSDAEDLDQVFKPGLGYVRNTLFAPHWDIVDGWRPGARAAITAAAPPGGTLVALDEDTAMVGDGATWTVHGRQGIHLYRGDSWSDHVAGDRFDLSMGVNRGRPDP